MTLKDIARLSGVSTATVSNVINGNYHKVSKETIEKIQQIVQEYDYRPNATARSLAKKESRIIGIVIPYLADTDVFSKSPYNTLILGCLERYIRSQGYYMMIRSVGSCMESIPIFSTWNVDGIIFFGAQEKEAVEIRQVLDIPAVYIDTYAEDESIATVVVNDYLGGRLAAEYLLSRGHRRIAIAGPVSSAGVIEHRYRGYSEACRGYGVELTPECWFEGLTEYDSGLELGKQIARSERDFTAVAAASDILALGILEGIRQSGKRVPEDISIIGYDDLPECLYAYPQLTTVSQNVEKKGNLAAEYLFRQIQGKGIRSPHQPVDIQIVERQSVRRIGG